MEPIDKSQYQKISHLSLRVQLSAMAVATSFILIAIPNVETISLTSFLLGFLFPLKFALITVLTMVLTWEFFASMVFTFSGLTFPFKIFAWLLITLLGWFGRKIQTRYFIEFAIFGAISALLFDFLVTIPLALFFTNQNDIFLSILFANIILGLVFTITHIISNALLFAMLPFILKSILPILHSKYSELVCIPRGAFTYLPTNSHSPQFQWHFQRITKKRLLSYFLAFLAISSLITIAIVQPKMPDNTPAEFEISISLNYNGILPNETYTISVSQNDTALISLESVAMVNYTLKYAGIPYVEAINGVWENLNFTGFYWIFYINSNPSPTGVASTYLSPGDQILWNYEN